MGYGDGSIAMISYKSIFSGMEDPKLPAIGNDVHLRVQTSYNFWILNGWFSTMWGPRSIAKLVNITPITMVYGTQITIVSLLLVSDVGASLLVFKHV